MCICMYVCVFDFLQRGLNFVAVLPSARTNFFFFPLSGCAVAAVEEEEEEEEESISSTKVGLNV